MRVRINGDAHELDAVTTVADLVKTLSLSPATLLIEHNGTALRRDEWSLHPLCDDDQIELLQIAAGG
jgi:thiamine biosynthesis protein ThiS